MATLNIDSSAIVGKTFTVNDPTLEYTCIGYAANETFLVVGSRFDSVNNRSTVHTFKVSEVKFQGAIIPKSVPV
jgi:hypothetical protein